MEYFKVVNDKNYYVIAPTSILLPPTKDPEEWPFCFLSLIIQCYNFSIDNFFKYIISKFKAQVLVNEEWPHFFIVFKNKNDADNFCKEINLRMKK